MSVPPVDPGDQYSYHTIQRPKVVRMEYDPYGGVDMYRQGVTQPLQGLSRDSIPLDYEISRLDAECHGVHVEPRVGRCT